MRGFRLTLAAIVIAGVLQIFMGLMRWGTLGLAVPINALHGMMASIGITIITKQMYVLGGIKPAAKNLIGQIIELPSRLLDDNMVILAIGVLCLLIVIGVNYLPRVKKVAPPALFAVMIGYALSLFIDIEHSHFINIFNHEYHVGPEFLLSIPQEISGYFHQPLFQDLTSTHFFKAVITIALVASIESLLSTYAVDKLDPLKRTSNLNKDLISKGASNILLGFIGGLPIISEIVRSTANISSGATNRVSNFAHGVFILVFILLFPQFLSHIPLSAFAAILIFVGFRLANPLQILNVYKSGKSQVLIFLVTIATTLSTDLLIGIFTGAALELAINFIKVKDFPQLFKINTKIAQATDQVILHVDGSCVFTNMLSLKGTIEAQTAKVIIVQFLPNQFVDTTSKDLLQTLQQKFLNEKRILLFKNVDISSQNSGH